MRSKVLTSFVVALTLLGMSACSSDKKAAPAGTSVITEDSAPAEPVVTAVGSDDEIRAMIVQQVVDLGVQGSYKFDAACVADIVKQLSAADLEQFRTNLTNPNLSPEEGE